MYMLGRNDGSKSLDNIIYDVNDNNEKSCGNQQNKVVTPHRKKRCRMSLVPPELIHLSSDGCDRNEQDTFTSSRRGFFQDFRSGQLVMKPLARRVITTLTGKYVFSILVRITVLTVVYTYTPMQQAYCTTREASGASALAVVYSRKYQLRYRPFSAKQIGLHVSFNAKKTLLRHPPLPHLETPQDIMPVPNTLKRSSDTRLFLI